MSPASVLNPEDPAFDRVIVTRDGQRESLRYAEFMKMPLAKRIELILAGEPTFYSGTEVIDKKRALFLG